MFHSKQLATRIVGIDVSLKSISDALNTLLLDALIVGAIVNIITVIIAYLLFKPFVMRIGSFTGKIKNASDNKDLTEVFMTKGIVSYHR